METKGNTYILACVTMIVTVPQTMASRTGDDADAGKGKSKLIVVGGEIGARQKGTGEFNSYSNFSLDVVGVFREETDGFVFKVKHALSADGGEPESWYVFVLCYA